MAPGEGIAPSLMASKATVLLLDDPDIWSVIGESNSCLLRERESSLATRRIIDTVRARIELVFFP